MKFTINLIYFLILICFNLTISCQNKLIRSSSTKNCDTIISLPIIGDIFKIDLSTQRGLLINPSQMWPSKCVIVENVKFDIAVGDDYKVKYIATSDSTFHTPDNITTQNTLKELIDRFGDKLYAQRGYGWIFNLPSGWNACFVESDKSFGIIRPDDSKRISWISK